MKSSNVSAPIEGLTSLKLANSKTVTDKGVRHLARLTTLRELDLNSTSVTDEGLRVLHDLPALESLSLVMTNVTDAGLEHIRTCDQIKKLNLMWTRTGDGVIRALSGKKHFSHLWSGNYLTDTALPLLHDLPVFAEWRGGTAEMALLGNEVKPNQIELRGLFTDGGMRALQGLDGLFGLSIDDNAQPLTARGIEPLMSLPHPCLPVARRERRLDVDHCTPACASFSECPRYNRHR